MIGPVMIENDHDPPDHVQVFFQSVFDRHKNDFLKFINLILNRSELWSEWSWSRHIVIGRIMIGPDHDLGFVRYFSIDRVLIAIRSGSMHNTNKKFGKEFSSIDLKKFCLKYGITILNCDSLSWVRSDPTASILPCISIVIIEPVKAHCIHSEWRICVVKWPWIIARKSSSS